MDRKLKDKLIITAAITGSRILRDTTPYIPYTPEEIARSAIECWDAGAAIVDKSNVKAVIELNKHHFR